MSGQPGTTIQARTRPPKIAMAAARRVHERRTRTSSGSAGGVVGVRDEGESATVAYRMGRGAARVHPVLPSYTAFRSTPGRRRTRPWTPRPPARFCR